MACKGQRVCKPCTRGLHTSYNNYYKKFCASVSPYILKKNIRKWLCVLKVPKNVYRYPPMGISDFAYLSSWAEFFFLIIGNELAQKFATIYIRNGVQPPPFSENSRLHIIPRLYILEMMCNPPCFQTTSPIRVFFLLRGWRYIAIFSLSMVQYCLCRFLGILFRLSIVDVH